MCSPIDALLAIRLRSCSMPKALDDANMQAVAREFNLSETVFVLPPAQRSHRARLRIFTPAAELPFAGHPTVGTAVLLGRIDAAGGGEMILEEGVGDVRCRVEPIDGERGRAIFDLPRLPAEIGPAAETSRLAARSGCAGRTSGSAILSRAAGRPAPITHSCR